MIGRVFLDMLFGSDLVAWLSCQISTTFHFNHEMPTFIEIDQDYLLTVNEIMLHTKKPDKGSVAKKAF